MKKYYEIYDKTKKYKNTVCLVNDEDIAKDFCLKSEVYDYVERVMSPCGECEAQVDLSEAKNYCDTCKANNYSHYFTNDNTGVSTSEPNTEGWGTETGLIKQVLAESYNLNVELMNKDYQINALVSLVKELGFEEFLVNQYGELYGYSYNGFSSNENPTEEQIERFNALKDLLPVKTIKGWK